MAIITLTFDAIDHSQQWFAAGCEGLSPRVINNFSYSMCGSERGYLFIHLVILGLFSLPDFTWLLQLVSIYAHYYVCVFIPIISRRDLIEFAYYGHLLIQAPSASLIIRLAATENPRKGALCKKSARHVSSEFASVIT